MSPAMVLIHELAHGVVHIAGLDSHYDTAEDRYIIEHYERVIGQQLGEPTRQDHQGLFVPVNGVTYHAPAPGS